MLAFEKALYNVAPNVSHTAAFKYCAMGWGLPYNCPPQLAQTTAISGLLVVKKMRRHGIGPRSLMCLANELPQCGQMFFTER